MRRTTPEPIEAGGQDSFVDVVTNLVGILIVLVLIVGVRVKPAGRARSAAESATVNNEQSNGGSDGAGESAAVKGLEATAAGVESDIHQTVGQIASLQNEAARRSAERDHLAVLVTASQRTIDERRDKLAAADRTDFDLRQQMAGLAADLDRGRQILAAASTDRQPPVEMKHYLTPLSRTVFGKEVHFRLADGRIVYVPFDELAERAKSEIRADSSSLSDLTDHVHVAGPYGGFQMEFTVSVAAGSHPGEVGIALREARLTSIGGDLGETLHDALEPTSEFHRQLAGYDSSQTTVTVWVYSESFGEYRAINDELVRLGFAVAARPMPTGRPIGISDRGSRSAAE